MAKKERRALLRVVPAWLAMPLMTLMVLGLVAFALTRRDPNRWQDLAFPAFLGAILISVMVFWLLYVRRVEARLREERNFLRVLIDLLPDRIFIKDTSGRRVLSNEADWRSVGVARMDQVIGKTVYEIYPPDLASQYSMTDQEVLESGQPILNREEPGVNGQGNRLWTLTTEVPLRDTDQNLRGVVGIVRDITAFKRSIEAERTAEERYRLIFEESVEGIYQTTPEGTIVTINPAMAKIFGYASTGEMIALVNDVERHFYVDPTRRTEFKHRIESEGRVAGFESEMYRKDGSRIWISENGRVVRDENGAIRYYEGTMVDITQRKRAEAALRDSEARFSSAFAYAAIGMALVGSDGRWIKVNRALRDLVGYSEAELLGMTFQDITHPDDLELDLEYVRRLLAGEIQSYRMEKRYCHKSGRFVWVLLSVSLVRDVDGSPQYFVSQIQDITDRKRAEESERETQRKQEIWIGELEQQTREISLLNEMSDLIQCCSTVDEAYRVIEQQVPWLFPEDSGAVYIINASRNLAEARAAWGAAFDDPRAFKPADCWGFRRGQMHAVETIWTDDPSITEPLLVCNHVQQPLPEAFICLPLVAQGETLGVFHLRHPKPSHLDPAVPRGVWYTEGTRQLARTVADSLALSISNLSLRESLRQQSIRDALTGMFNRRYLEESLEREVARAARANLPVSVVMLDIDEFKPFNDRFGHAAGDALLRRLGALLRSEVREADIGCRYGGDEFALIMPDAPLEAARARAEKIREAVKQFEVQHGGRLLAPVTISVGVAQFPLHGRTGDAALEKADAALYQAKQTGRDQVVVAETCRQPQK